MQKIIKYVITDILRNKIVIAYTLLLLIISFSVFNLEDNTSKGLLSLMNIVLIIVPLICIIFSTIYVYNSSEFIELLVSQPLQRKHIWISLFAGMAIALDFVFFYWRWHCCAYIFFYSYGNHIGGSRFNINTHFCGNCITGRSLHKRQSQRHWHCRITVVVFFIDIRWPCIVHSFSICGLPIGKTNAVY